MVSRLFHRWERRLAARSDGDRVVRPFEWGIEWIPQNGHEPREIREVRTNPHLRLEQAAAPDAIVHEWVDQVLKDPARFFDAGSTTAYNFDPNGWGGDGLLTFPSALGTPHPANNIVYARYLPARGRRAKKLKRAVLVLPQWNSDDNGHVGLSRILTHAGLSALRLSLPYHDRRMPPELSRADYIVSSNIGRTLQVCRQAVLDARRAIAWLAARGYERIGILGTSLGSCLAMLTSAHEPLVRAQALNHVSPYFADVVWEGLSTAHVRAGLEGRIDLDRLRSLWLPISPQHYLEHVRTKKTLLVYARYDLTFPVALSRALIREFQSREIPHQVAELPCGHYSTGKVPFKFLDAWVLTRFLTKTL